MDLTAILAERGAVCNFETCATTRHWRNYLRSFCLSASQTSAPDPQSLLLPAQPPRPGCQRLQQRADILAGLLIVQVALGVELFPAAHDLDRRAVQRQGVERGA